MSLPVSEKTRERILDAAEEIMRTKSFHSVGLNEILTAVQIPKGSFYHYFSSKEQFGVELIQRYVAEDAARLDRFLVSGEVKALQRLTDYWTYRIGIATEGSCQQCCLVVRLSLEVTNFSERMREALAAGLKSTRETYERVLREGQADGSVRSDIRPAETAALIQDLWQGAQQRMQVERSVSPLRVAAQFLRSHLAGVNFLNEG